MGGKSQCMSRHHMGQVASRTVAQLGRLHLAIALTLIRFIPVLSGKQRGGLLEGAFLAGREQLQAFRTLLATPKPPPPGVAIRSRSPAPIATWAAPGRGSQAPPNRWMAFSPT